MLTMWVIPYYFKEPRFTCTFQDPMNNPGMI